ncbi:MAG: OmpA family protein, partial [Rhodothermaceae bacterium]|nr:OmpA family protein [Rhodothermaceae bacterium]
IPLPEPLPEQFTVEFRVMTTDPLHRANLQLFSDGSDDTPDTRCTYPPNPHLFVQSNGQGLQLPGGYGAPKAEENMGLTENEWMTVALGCDGPYCKMFIDGERVANVPNYEFPKASKLHVFMNVYRYSLFVDDIRIAEGGARSLYDDLQAEGFISTNAIRFDSGSATLKPESGGILNEILMMLQEHSDLDLLVEGHTDSDGADDANQTLSEDRAEAVAAWFIDHGIDAGRLDTVGHGESQPVSDNGTAEGKAENRRVVFRQR